MPGSIGRMRMLLQSGRNMYARLTWSNTQCDIFVFNPRQPNFVWRDPEKSFDARKSSGLKNAAVESLGGTGVLGGGLSYIFGVKEGGE